MMDVEECDADLVDPGTSQLGQGDTTDARSMGYSGGTGGTGNQGIPVMPSTADLQDPQRYNMSHARRGLAIIINNKTFDRRTGMNERSGTDDDAANLYERLKALDFEVHRYQNKTASEMVKIMRDAGKDEHANCDCFVMAVLSHGDEGVVYGTDGIIEINTLTSFVKGEACPTLIGKPKLFIIQACRGSMLDHGVEMTDSDTADILPKSQRIPTEADVLMAFSTVPGYFSWRNSKKGSWFVQALCRMLDKHGTTMDLMWILTRVNYAVAYEFQSNASREYMNRKKQIPCIMSMLTKDLYFTPKKQ